MMAGHCSKEFLWKNQIIPKLHLCLLIEENKIKSQWKEGRKSAE